MKKTWVKQKIITEVIGISKNALNKKRYRSIFIENIHWKKAPDNMIYYNLPEIIKWIES
ncbi:excisionase family protein [Photobacterium leiognathi]|uniref:excisionase family protein n=1 Tax=Photobacterium leiognathi TaxID=553611 RepID=UPI002981EA94|nr:excisionase family protein [Photobacterium leiognathi]